MPGKIIKNPGMAKKHRQRGGGSNLVYLQGEEVDHPQEVGGSPDDGGGDDSEPREEEGDETDEDTISIRDSSTPDDPGKGNGAEGPQEEGARQRIQIISLRRE